MCMSSQRWFIYLSFVALGISTTLYGYSLRKDLQGFNLSIIEVQLLEIVPLLPWCYKCVFAYYSEKIPLFGSHQKHYLILMNFLSAVLCCVLIEPRKNYQELLLVLFFQQSCAVWADCVLDTLKIIETNRDIVDEEGSNGRFNTRVQICRTIGYWIGDSSGPILWLKMTSRGVYGLLSLAYFFPLIFAFFITEHPLSSSIEKGCLNNVSSIWGRIRHPVLGKLLLFILVTGVFIPSSSTPVFFFLNDIVLLSPEKQSWLKFIAHLMEIVSLMVFDRWVRKWTLRKMYVLFSLLQILVTLFLLFLVVEVPGTTCLHPPGVNGTCYYYEYAHLDPFGLAMGENVLGDSIDELFRLPLVTVTSQLCVGPLGPTMFTTIYALQNICGGIFAGVWNSQVTSVLGIDHFQFKNLPILIGLGSIGWFISAGVAAWKIPSITFSEIEDDRMTILFVSKLKNEFKIPSKLTSVISPVEKTTGSEAVLIL